MSKYLKATVKATLLNAMRHPYYRQNWPDRDIAQIDASGDEECIEILESLPATPKAAMAGLLPPMPLDGDAIVKIGHTTGTTGTPHMWYMTRGEVEAWSSIKSRLSEAGRKNSELKRLGLRISPPFHGTSSPSYSESDATYSFNCSVRDDHAFKTTKWLLTSTHEVPSFEPRISELTCTPNILVTLTEALIGSSIKASDLGVKRICLYGGYFNRPYRDFVQSYWRVVPLDMYSTSEIKGGGLICNRCGMIDFPPHIHASISPIGRSSAHPMLRLTALLPFNSAQPLINFENGDVAEYLDNSSACCDAHVNGIRVIGRLEKSVSYDEGGRPRLILTSHEIHDIFFDAGIDKERTAFQGLSMLPWPAPMIGLPRVEIPSSVAYGSPLIIRYAPDPHRYVSPEDVRQRLLRRSQRLSQFASRAEGCFSLVPDASCAETIWK